MSEKLTIAIISLNRAEQLRNAINSCLQCKLPAYTEFVILSNGSTDNTDSVMSEIMADKRYAFTYIKEDTNIGASLGRNKCFERARGEYVFYLDDDAEIAPECFNTFFLSTIEYLDSNKDVAALTTEIVDKVFGYRAIKQSKAKLISGKRCAYTFHEGTVFLRRNAFENPLFMDIKYGGEGLYVSSRLHDKGYEIVFDDSIHINHYPSINKWKNNPDAMNVESASNIYIIKRTLYPRLFFPVLYLCYKLRLKRYQLKDNTEVKRYKSIIRQSKKLYIVDKIKVITVIKLFLEFGLTVF